MATKRGKPVDRRLGRTVRVDGQDVYLTPAEHRLWEVLRGQPGRTFTRAELAAHVMPDAVVLERTIDVHIRSLRHKLGRAASMIETVYRVGYRSASAPTS